MAGSPCRNRRRCCIICGDRSEGGAAVEPELYEKRGYLLEDFRLFHLRDTAMAPVDWHYHAFHKIIFFLSGQAAYDIEGQRYRLEPGDILLVGRGSIHRPEVAEGVPYERAILYISPAFLRAQSGPACDLEACFAMARQEFRFALRPAARDNRLPQILSALERALESGGFGAELLCRSLFLQLLIEVSRGLLEHGLAYVTNAVFDEKTVAILQYLNAHLTEPIAIDDLAAKFYISKYYMMRRFRAETGYTIHSYLVGKRLLLARERIAAGMSVTDACYQSGFQDYSTFSRAYKKQFGQTPRQTE